MFFELINCLSIEWYIVKMNVNFVISSNKDWYKNFFNSFVKIILK